MSCRRTIVVFGSVVSDPNKAGDIDVVYTGNKRWTNKDEKVVRKWFTEKKGISNLPIDKHFCSSTWMIDIPLPCGREDFFCYEIIKGKAEIIPRSFWGIASMIRAYGDNVFSFKEKLEEKKFFQLGILKKSDSWDNWDYFDSYTQGLTALRSAVKHAPEWKQIVESFPFGRILNRLVEEDPRPTDFQFLNLLEKGSSTISDALELCFFSSKNGKWRISGKYLPNDHQWPTEELEDLLWP